jgi:hypothetical protein
VSRAHARELLDRGGVDEVAAPSRRAGAQRRGKPV